MLEWVDGNVAIGSWRDADGHETLTEEGIDIIVDARILFDDSNGRGKRTPRLDAIAKEITYINALVAMGAKILIRCHHGRDRAPFVAMFYLSQKENIPYQKAYDDIKIKRPRTVFHWDWVHLLEMHTPGPCTNQ